VRATYLALLTLGACATDTDQPFDAVAAASAPGAYGVGYAKTSTTWSPPWGTPDGTGIRELPVELWYPAASTSDARATYLVAGLVEREAPLAQDTPAPAPGPHPVAVYSHGSGGLGLIAYPFAERLASHGWIVISADHLGNTSFDLISGGGEPFLATMVNRPRDVTALLDLAERGALDGLDASMDEVFLFGHSFGGYTTFSAGGVANQSALWASGCDPSDTDEDCLLALNPDVQAALDGAFIDPRIDAIAPQAPALVSTFAEGALASLPIPTLMQSAGRDLTTPDETEASPAWDQLDDPRDRWIRIPDGGHYSFISVCDDVGLDVIEVFQPGASADGCGPDNTPTLETVPVLATYLTAFAEAYVRGEDAYLPVLDAALHPGFKVKQHGE
jgi:predicted dienelactone hydrolase